ncbi:hypothetical protein H072_8495 [Dactylellina haptotyla CBS 200.50]|uniref:Uncharacterized protein n=1 Tax=Dactylellina haptotyla (strain CBS 200.50) TaxID=1284197 RepID=S8A4K1_DACHA|nr:hypothetical protein H072_8495 [Dactylellina haptotyla CBS 200.50]
MASESQAKEPVVSKSEQAPHKIPRRPIALYHETVPASDLRNPRTTSEIVGRTNNLNESLDLDDIVRRTDNMSIENQSRTRTESVSSMAETAYTTEETGRVLDDSNSDSDSDDDDFFEEKIAFTMMRAQQYIDKCEWGKAEHFVLQVIKNFNIHRKKSQIAGQDGKIGGMTKTEWVLKLIEIRARLSKWNDAVATMKTLKDSNPRVETRIESEMAHWQAFLYFHLDDIENARRCCKKAIKLRRKEPPDSGTLYISVELMVRIVKDIGDEVEVEFYESLVEKLHEKAKPALENQKVPFKMMVREKEKARLLEDIGLKDLQPLSTGPVKPPTTTILAEAIRNLIKSNNMVLANIIFTDLGFYSFDCSETDVPCSPLHYAISHKNVDMVSFLLNLGANIMAMANTIKGVLHTAIDAGSTELIHLLVERGYPADGIDFQINNYLPPLHYACIIDKSPKVVLVKALIDAGANLEKPCLTPGVSLDRQLAITIAITQKNVALLRVLLDAGANPDIFRNGAAPLHHAVVANDELIVALLLERGAKRDVRNGGGATPKEMAQGGYGVNNKAIAKML